MMSMLNKVARNPRPAVIAVLCIIILSGLFFRTSGIYRGLKTGVDFHPDAPKQVFSFHNYMNDRYVWYDGTLFIDGYPLFLNHFDEWLSRPLASVYEVASRHLYGEKENLRLTGKPYEDYYPSGVWLFYWLRSLRVLYSILLVPAAYFIARIIGLGRVFSLLAALLMSLSPMEWISAHSATGDIGVSLFGAGLYLAAWRYAWKRQLLFLIVAGILGGFAFASKYQGLLVCGMFFSYLLIQHVYFGKRWRRFFVHTGLFIVSVLAGIAAATPQFFINYSRTRRLIFENIEFVKNYTVPPDILAKPAWELALLSIQKNAWPLINALGPLALLCGLIGLLYLSVLLLRKKRDLSDEQSVRLSYTWSLIAIPFYCIAISVAGKYNMHTFHFAYLNLPIAVAACYALHVIWHRVPRWGVPLAAVMAAVLLVGRVQSIARDYHYWSRPEAHEVRINLEGELMGLEQPVYEDIGVIRVLKTEGDQYESFRNRDSSVQLPFSSFWNNIKQLPLPDIPFPGKIYWIHENGPTYLRNDRSFLIADRETVEKTVIWQETPQQIKIGLRSGVFPVWIELEAAGVPEKLYMPPNSQRVLNISDDAMALMKKDEAGLKLPLVIRSSNGSVWATILSGEKAEAVFRLYGGELTAIPDVLVNDLEHQEEIIRQTSLCAYYAQSIEKKAYIKEGEALKLLDFDPLPAGMYVFKAGIVIPETGVRLELKGADPFLQTNWRDIGWTVPYDLSPGFHEIAWTFEKKFIPYAYQLHLGAVSGTASVVYWSVKPAAGAIMDALAKWNEEGSPPVWVQNDWENHVHDDAALKHAIRFSDRYELAAFKVAPGDREREVKATIQLKQLKPDDKAWELVTYVHIVDDQGKLRGVAGFPLYLSLSPQSISIPIICVMDDDLSGTFSMWMGIYSSRTFVGLPVESDSESSRIKRRRIYMGDITF